MIQWFRFYHEVLDDPKVQNLPAATFKSWVNILCLAARNDGALPSVIDIAFALRIPEWKTAALLQILTDAGLLDRDETATLKPHNWGGRQFKSDGSSERVKRFRERSANVTNVVSRNVTHKATETGPEQNRTEQIQKNPPNPLFGAFEKRWALYPNPVGKKAAEKHFAASVKTEADLADIDKALSNYKQAREHENAHRRELIPWQNGSTWFNNWRDWVHIKPNGNKSASAAQDFRSDADPPHTQHRCEFCDPAHWWPCPDPGNCDMGIEVACPQVRAKLSTRKS